MRSIDISRILDRANEDEPTTCLNPDLAAEVLLDKLKGVDLSGTGRLFIPDTILRQRAGWATYRYPAPTFPAVFVRYLDPLQWEWIEGHGWEDAVIAVEVEGDVGLFRVASFRFEEYPEGELNHGQAKRTPDLTAEDA